MLMLEPGHVKDAKKPNHVGGRLLFLRLSKAVSVAQV